MKFYRLGLFTLSALAAVVFSTGRAHAQVTLLNGSFEAPAVTATTLSGGTSWTSAGLTFVVPNSMDFGETPYGTQYLGLTTGSSDTQTVAGFQAGQIYVVGFDFADYETGGGTPTLTVTLSGVYNFAESFTAPTAAYSGTSTIPFTSEVIIFAAPLAGSETLTLADTGTTSIPVDNVGLYGNAVVTVPEPASITAALLGLGALVGAVRYRSRRA